MGKKFAVIFGIIFILVGLLGFFNNPIVGATSFFYADALQNILHLLVGIVFLIAAGAGENASILWLKVWGIIYLILFIDGLFQPASLLGILGSNGHDTYLYIAAGLILVIIGFSLDGKSVMADKATM
jgi:hypothetical protein